MNFSTRSLLVVAILAVLSPTAMAAPMRYQGQLSDAGKPANGRYDVQISLHDAASAGVMLDAAVTFEDVDVQNGQFLVEFDAPPSAQNGSVWLQAAVRDGFSAGSFAPINTREKVVLEPLIATCWSSTGDTGSNPTVNYLGNSDNQTLVLNSPSGVSINKRAQIASGTADLLVAPKSTGDADADIRLQSRTGKEAALYVRDNNGSLVAVSDSAGMEFFDGVSTATQNNGLELFNFSGRLRSQAAGVGATDVGGGIWLDDESPNKAYLGRGTNDQNWTGVFAGGGWRMAVGDDGLVSFNSTVAPGGLQGTDMVLTARPAPNGDADSDFVWQTRSGKLGRIYLSDSSGGFTWTAFNLAAGNNFLTTSNGASLSNGGTWTNASSRTLKQNFAPVDTVAMLEKLVALPITTWTYKTSTEGTHIGPIAEDFKASFGLAGDGKSIATVDADGVALAAIQGLNAKLENENAQLRARMAVIEQALLKLQR